VLRDVPDRDLVAYDHQYGNEDVAWVLGVLEGQEVREVKEGQEVQVWPQLEFQQPQPLEEHLE